MSTSATIPSVRELDSHESDGLSVTLTWEPASGRTFVSLLKGERRVVYEVPAERAYDAFQRSVDGCR